MVSNRQLHIQAIPSKLSATYENLALNQTMANSIDLVSIYLHNFLNLQMISNMLII